LCIQDARVMGNIGKFFNHSCDPNVFVQNVFVDSHDLRFPWLGFFTSRRVGAGEELAWDYCYQVGPRPGPSPRWAPCRGRGSTATAAPRSAGRGCSEKNLFKTLVSLAIVVLLVQCCFMADSSSMIRIYKAAFTE
jgi:hypothetical protein